jgi:hypothetical protein
MVKTYLRSDPFKGGSSEAHLIARSGCQNRTDFVLDNLTQPERNCPVGNWKGFTREYEIRVLSAGHTITVIEEFHFSDHSAVRSAKKFAGNQPFELWRGLDRVYGTPNAGRDPKAGHSPSP